MVKVLIAHPHRLMGDGLACLLSGADDIDVAGTYRTAGDLIHWAEYHRPEVIVTTAAFADAEGPEFIASLKAASDSTAILIIASTGSTGDFLWALDAGAAGYFGPDCDSTQFIDSVYKLSRGEVVIVGVDRKSFSSATTPETKPNPAIYNLTPREREVLNLLARGLSNRQIAQELYVSEHTVRTHVQNLRSKLKVRSKFEAAVLAMQANAPAKAGWLKL